MKAALELGRWTFLAPLGYLNAPRATGKSLISDPERASLVRRAFQDFATGRFTKDEVRKNVVALGLTTRRGKPVPSQTFDAMLRTARMLGMPVFAAGHGYGMGVAVVTEPDQADPLRCRGAVGTVGWPGAYGGWWQADPTDNSVLIFLAHNMLDLQQMASGIGLDAWSAIAKFHELASA